MGLAEELIAIKMRLTGATSYQREMVRNTEVTTEYGASAERAGAQAKAGATGIDAMAASSKVGVGAMASMKKTGEGMKSTGSKMTAAFTVPLLLIGGLSIKAALDFNESMALIQTQAGASAHELAFLEKGVMKLAASGKTGFTDNELAEGLYAIRSAGITGSKALETLRTASDFAEVGQAGLAETTKALVSAQNSGIKGTTDLHKEIGTLNATIGAGQMHMGELNSAIGTGFLGTAKALGINLTEVGGALSFLTREGTPASAAATRLRMAFSLIANPTEKAQDALKGIGLSQTDLALKMRGPNGVVEGLKILNKHLGENYDMSTKLGKVGATQLLAEAFGGAKSGGTILQLLGNMKSLEQTTSAVKNNTGQITGAIVKAESTGEEKLKHTWSQFNNTLIELGQVLIPVVIPAIRSLANAGKSAVEWFANLPEPVQKIAIYFGLVAAVAGPILIFFGSLVTAVGTLAAAFAVVDVETAGIPLLVGTVAALFVGLTGIFGGTASQADRMGTVFEHVKNDMEQQKTAGKNLVASENSVAGAKKRHQKALGAFKTAQQHANQVIGQYGRKSRPAIHADETMARKKWDLVRANHALSTSEREHGIAKKMFMQITKTSVLEARHEINMLKMKKEQFSNLFTQEEKNHASNQRLNEIAEWGTHTNQRLEGAHKKLNEVILEASQKVGPKYAKFLSKAKRETVEWGSSIQEALGKGEQILEFGEKLEGLARQPRNPHTTRPGEGNHGAGAAHPGGVRRNTSGGGKPPATVSLMRDRGGPTPMKLRSGRDGGAKRGSGGKQVPVQANLYIGRRKFGEAMTMALIDEDVNE